MSVRESPQPLFAAVSLERRIVELTILYEVSRALQQTLDEEQALYTILVGVTARRGLGFNRAFILLVDAEEQHLRGRLAIGPSSPEEADRIWLELREKHHSLGELLASVSNGIQKDLPVNEIVSRLEVSLAESNSPLVEIMRSHDSCLAINGRFEPLGVPVPQSLTGSLGVDNFAVAPLYLADKDLGILIADNAITRSPIDQTCLKLLQIYAQQASAAIQNTRLYRELMEKITLCENTNLTLRENQDQMLRVERLSTMGKMSALLAHEIRTPLVSIGGFARRMLRSTAPDDPRKEEMEIIVSEVTRLERLVDEVLGYARLTRPEYRPVDVNNMIRSLKVTMQDEITRAAVRLVLEMDPRLLSAEIDESQLRQVLMNLVTNALDAMPSGGTLKIRTLVDFDYFEIGVTDTGTGINQEHWNKLFTPFFTTKSSGTGLGLAIVSQVIENHGGSLRFESTPQQGTSFHIRLALHPPTSNEPTPLSVAIGQETVP